MSFFPINNKKKSVYFFFCRFHFNEKKGISISVCFSFRFIACIFFQILFDFVFQHNPNKMLLTARALDRSFCLFYTDIQKKWLRFFVFNKQNIRFCAVFSIEIWKRMEMSYFKRFPFTPK